jgi:hypothetical protein
VVGDDGAFEDADGDGEAGAERMAFNKRPRY